MPINPDQVLLHVEQQALAALNQYGRQRDLWRAFMTGPSWGFERCMRTQAMLVLLLVLLFAAAPASAAAAVACAAPAAACAAACAAAPAAACAAACAAAPAAACAGKCPGRPASAPLLLLLQHGHQRFT
jgi:hypothetical protein